MAHEQMSIGNDLTPGNEEKTVVVVVPVYKERLTADEEISLRHLRHYLGDYPRYAFAPTTLNVPLAGFEIKRFHDKFFRNTSTYSMLLLSKDFYRAFSAYDYILVYQLDALVFSDRLSEWCTKGLDYVGAPWFRTPITAFVSEPRVGNGGLSLRRIGGFLKVLESKRYAVDPQAYWESFCAARPRHARLLNLPRKYLKRLRAFNGVGWETSRWPSGKTSPFGPNEDCFWSFEAVKYYPDFRIASVTEALRFAFEIEPRRCFEMNNGRLPFGCHGWAKYDRSFWEPYLLR
jgi:Protein of unknown function (DUF5672)